MKHNKVNINRPKISSEEIEARKDFDGLLNRMNIPLKPFYRQIWFAPVSIAAVAAIVIVAWFFIPVKKNNISQLPFIINPIKGVDVAYNVYTVNADSGKDITCKSGSRILIPAGAFTDAQGKVLKGSVKVKYREFRDAVDIFVSGIPMVYDSGGTKYQFESAGMCEILALQDGQPVNPNPDAPITIQYKSNYPGTQYNLYELDTNARNWKCIGKDKVEAIAQQPAKDSNNYRVKKRHRLTVKEESITPVIDTDLSHGVFHKDAIIQNPEENALKNVKNEIAKLEKTKPEKPLSVDKVKRHFQFKVNPEQFPELSTYSNVMFTIVGVDDKDVPKAVFNTVWKNVKLEENIKGVNYKMTVSKDAVTYTYIVCPVFEGPDYDNAMKIYDEKYKEYTTALAKKQAEEKREADRIEDFKKSQAALVNMPITDTNINAYLHTTEAVVFRTFTALRFDVIYNCDHVAYLRNYVTIHAGFEDQNGIMFYLSQVYIANSNLNGLIAFSGPKIGYEPEATNVMWGLTPDKKLAYFTPADFKAIPKTDSYTFKMRIYDGELKTEADVRKVLGM